MMRDDGHVAISNQLKTLLKEQILVHVIDTVFDICRMKKIGRGGIDQLIMESKDGQLGKSRLVNIVGFYDYELLTALNQISRLYEEPVKTVKLVFGQHTPSSEDIKNMSDLVIIELLDTYLPVQEAELPRPPRPSAPSIDREFDKDLFKEIDIEKLDEAMSYIRARLIEYVKTKNITCVHEIMECKRKAGIDSAGIYGDWNDCLNLSFLDLSGLDLRERNFKGVSFDNCNLMGTKFGYVSRCTFENADLTESEFHGSTMQGEEVSFKNAIVTRAKFINVELERASDHRYCVSIDQIVAELKQRGAIDVNKAIIIRGNERRDNDYQHRAEIDRNNMFYNQYLENRMVPARSVVRDNKQDDNKCYLM